MSNKIRSLGLVAGAVNGITCSGGTNATPIVATIAPSTTHGLKNDVDGGGDRIHISGVTGLTAMNGEWSIDAVAATTAALRGSAGNGTFGGTAVVSALMDRTPFLPRHDCLVSINEGATAFVGTVLIEEGNSLDAAGAVNDFADAKKGLALPANPGHLLIEVALGKYMRLRASAFTGGSINSQVIA